MQPASGSVSVVGGGMMLAHIEIYGGEDETELITRDMTNLSDPSGPPVPAEEVAELREKAHHAIGGAR